MINKLFERVTNRIQRISKWVQSLFVYYLAVLTHDDSLEFWLVTSIFSPFSFQQSWFFIQFQLKNYPLKSHIFYKPFDHDHLIDYLIMILKKKINNIDISGLHVDWKPSCWFFCLVYIVTEMYFNDFVCCCFIYFALF